MGRSRLVVKLSIAAALVLLLGSFAWCGGPCAPGGAAGPAGAPGEAVDGGSVGQSYSGTQSSAAGAAGSGNFTMAGGGGNSNAGGSNGRSPFVPLQDLGLQSTLAKAARIAYDANDLGLSLRLSGDYIQSNWTGSKDIYTGPPAPHLSFGQPVDAKMSLTLLQGNADWYLGGMVCGGAPFSRLMDMAPRAQVVIYSDTLSYTGPTGTESGAKSFSMLGGGFSGYIDLAKAAGFMAPSYFCERTTPLPRITFAATIGQGDKMRYAEWEIFVQLRKVIDPCSGYAKYVPLSSIAAEVGWISYRFNETNEVVDPAFGRDGNVRFTWSLPVARGVLTF